MSRSIFLRFCFVLSWEMIPTKSVDSIVLQMVLILESGSIRYLKQPTIYHKHPTRTNSSPFTSNFCGLNNSLKCQLPFYSDIKWTNMFSLPTHWDKFPTQPAASTKDIGSSLALPVTTLLSWPSDATSASLLLVTLPDFSSGLRALLNHLAFTSVWSKRVGTKGSSELCDFLLGFLSQLGKGVRSSERTQIFKEKCTSEKNKGVP